MYSLVFALAQLILLVSGTETSIRLPKTHFSVNKFAEVIAKPLIVGKTSKAASVKSSDITGKRHSLVAYQFLNNKQCANTPEFASGLTFNQCFMGFDESGNVLGSGFYKYGGEGESYTHGSYSEFKSTDCSGDASYHEDYHYPKQCITDDTQSSSALYTMTNTTDMSTVLKNGVLFS
jgi:hypothetical protein